MEKPQEGTSENTCSLEGTLRSSIDCEPVSHQESALLTCGQQLSTAQYRSVPHIEVVDMPNTHTYPQSP